MFQKGKLTGVRVANIISFEVNRKREHARTKIVGIIVIVYGIADIAFSFIPQTVLFISAFLEAKLPDLIWRYSGFIEVAIGYGLMKLAGKGQDESELLCRRCLTLVDGFLEDGKEDQSGS